MSCFLCGRPKNAARKRLHIPQREEQQFMKNISSCDIAHESMCDSVALMGSVNAMDDIVITPKSKGRTEGHDEISSDSLPGTSTECNWNVATPKQSHSKPMNPATSDQRFSSPFIESAVRAFDETLKRRHLAEDCKYSDDSISPENSSKVDVNEEFSVLLEPVLVQGRLRREEIVLPRTAEFPLTWTDETDINLARISRLVPRLVEDRFSSSSLPSANSMHHTSIVTSETTTSSGIDIPHTDASLPETHFKENSIILTTSKLVLTSYATTDGTELSSRRISAPGSLPRSTTESHSSSRRHGNRSRSDSEPVIQKIHSAFSSVASTILSRLQLTFQESLIPSVEGSQLGRQDWLNSVPSLFAVCGPQQIRITTESQDN